MEKIERETQVYKKLSMAKSQQTPLIAWLSNDSGVISAEFLLYQVDQVQGQLELKVLPDSFVYLEDLIRKGKEIKIYMPQGSYFFFTKVLEVKPDGKVSIGFPEVLFFKERRQSDRANPSKRLRVHFSINNKKFNKNCYDLSVGGFSVVFNHTEQSGFEEKDPVEWVEFEFDGQRIKLNAVLSKVVKIKPFVFENIPYGQKKVSFEFKAMSKPKVTELEKLVHYMQKIYSD